MKAMRSTTRTVLAAVVLAGAECAVAGEANLAKSECLSVYTKDAEVVSEQHKQAMEAASRSEDAVIRTTKMLSAMGEGDQGIGEVALRAIAVCWDDLKELDMMRFIEVASGIGERNVKELKGIIRQGGWPRASIYGEDGEKAAFKVAQHADNDRDLQSQVLGLLQGLMAGEEKRPEYLAVLYDRVQVNQSKAQRYGSQGKCEGRAWVASAIEDPESVDRRRGEMGLEPMNVYVRKISTYLCGAETQQAQ